MVRARVEGPFSRRALAWAVGVSVSSLGLGLALLVAGAPESADVDSAGADAFSRSALGHRAFVALARGEKIPVVVSRHDSGRRAGASGILVVAEPLLPEKDQSRARRLAAVVEQARTALVVLPKWNGDEDPARPGWIRRVESLPVPFAGRVLSAIGVRARIARHAGSGPEECEGLRSVTSLVRPQLIVPLAPEIQPLVACEGGVLLAGVEKDGRRVFVLSDPDVLANHGLVRPGNERAVLEIVAKIRTGGEALVMDEVLHGHERVPTVWRELLAFPVLPAVVQATFALLALLLAGLSRFGAPVDAGMGLAPGKAVLIENTAFLLRAAGHSGQMLTRYLEAAVGEVARRLHVPAGAPPAELRRQLQDAARRRGVSVDLRAVMSRVERAKRRDAGPAAVVAAARQVHRFREEMLRGPQDHPGR